MKDAEKNKHLNVIFLFCSLKTVWENAEVKSAERPFISSVPFAASASSGRRIFSPSSYLLSLQSAAARAHEEVEEGQCSSSPETELGNLLERQNLTHSAVVRQELSIALWRFTNFWSFKLICVRRSCLSSLCTRVGPFHSSPLIRQSLFVTPTAAWQRLSGFIFPSLHVNARCLPPNHKPPVRSEQIRDWEAHQRPLRVVNRRR